jgi:hypothetical protein
MQQNARPYKAIFFITSGRTGTQWFAEMLSKHFQDLAVVRHEPFQEEYRPRFYFNAYHNHDKVVYSDALSGHLSSIKEITQRKLYIETGWPVYGILPFLISSLKEQVKVIHLYRHPLRVAASLTTHNFYSRGEWTEAVCLHPSDHGVVQDYLEGNRWESMTEFEKCLFWTTEINSYASRLQSDFPALPWWELKFEDVFSAEGKHALEAVLSFISLPLRPGFLEAKKDREDRHVLRTDQVLDTSVVTQYPHALAVMEELGYRVDQQLEDDLKDRYQDSVAGSLKRKLVRWVKKLYLSIRQPFMGS